MDLLAGISEEEALAELKQIASKNRVLKSFIGQGYYGTHTPKVIHRNVLENPAWYTAYTPYQPEISQGRLEILFYFQTMVCELTGMDISGASLLDEGTAAAEAMTLCQRSSKSVANRFLVSTLCHPQTIELVQTRAEPLGIEVVLFDQRLDVSDWTSVFGTLVQYPATDGSIGDFQEHIADAHQHSAMVVMASDLLALTILKSPGELGADVVVGNTQRFTRCIPGYQRCIQTHSARPPGWSINRFARQACVSTGVANSRATHSTREGHFQHLHSPGVVGYHGHALCLLPWPRRLACDRVASSWDDDAIGPLAKKIEL